VLTWRIASILFADEQQTELFEVQPWFEVEAAAGDVWYIYMD